MTRGSVEAIVVALERAGVRYLIAAGRAVDLLDLEALAKLHPEEPR